MSHRLRSPYTFHPLFGKVLNDTYFYLDHGTLATEQTFNSMTPELWGDKLWLEDTLRVYLNRYPTDPYCVIIETLENKVWIDINFPAQLDILSTL